MGCMVFFVMCGFDDVVLGWFVFLLFGYFGFGVGW